MTTTAHPSVIPDIDAIIRERHLLDHPFYRAWVDGQLSLEALQVYVQQYWHHVAAFPQYVSAAHATCPDMATRQVLLENLIEEERGPDNHPELWVRFGEALGLTRERVMTAEAFPETAALVGTYRSLCGGPFIDAAVALYSYESQIPAVAQTKIDGLRRFYGIEDERGLSFFTAHLQADVWHTETDRTMIESHVITEEDGQRARAAATQASEALLGLLDGVYDRYVKDC